MKETYEYWYRITEELKSAVEKAESELIVNLVFLNAAKKKLKHFPKPAKQTNPIVK